MDKDFQIWLHEMYAINSDERWEYKEQHISFEEYCNNNMEWLKIKYKELKEKENK